MQKTRLGISVGMLGAAIYLSGLFGGYVAILLLAGYTLLFEENIWLKKSAVKAVALLLFFSFLSVIIQFIPDVLDLARNITAIFDDMFGMTALDYIVSAIVGIIDIVKKILFLLLGIKALSQGTVTVPVVDNLINKYMG